jgi:SAM-dependent MidA family methyltransferase
VDYWSVENSLTRQAWQQQTLSAHSGRLNWVKSMAELPRNLNGVFYSNELLDAFPVVRVVWHASKSQWVEMGVGLQGDEWDWVPFRPVALETVSGWLALPLPPELLAVFPDGFTLDLIPEAARWWSEAAGTLRRGYLVAFDYGAEADELVSPRYARGTLRGYCRQRVVDRVLATPGEIDLTAHVNWTALNAAGVGQGLRTEFSGTQRQFLTEILTRRIQETGAGGLGWGPGEVRQFQTLTHPEHLGRAFRVLVQRR